MKTGYALKWIAFAFAASSGGFRREGSGLEADERRRVRDSVRPGGRCRLARARHHQDHDRGKVGPGQRHRRQQARRRRLGRRRVRADDEERQSEHAGAVQPADPDHAADGEGRARLARLDAGDESDARRLLDLRRQGFAVQDRGRPGEGCQGQAAQDDLDRLRRHRRRHGDRGLRVGGEHQAQRRALQFRRRGADRAARRPRQHGRGQPAGIHGLPEQRSGSPARRFPSDPLRRSAQRADDERAGHRCGAVPDVARRGPSEERPARRGRLLAGRDAEGRLVQGVHRLHQAERGDDARGQRHRTTPSSWRRRRRCTRTCSSASG